MADKGNARRPAGQDLEASSPDRIRNVVLVGPGGSGKTTLVEMLLATAGAVPRTGSVDDGTTVSDHDPGEQRHGRSHALSVAPLVHQGVKVNLLDTPGYADFVGEVRAGLRAADCALFVVAANEGVDVATRALWRECAVVGMPRAVVVTRLDQARADYEGVLGQAQAAFGDQVKPLFVPVRAGAEVTGLDRPARALRRGARGAARRPDRGRDRGVRGRDADGPLPRRRGDRRQDPGRRPRARGRPRDVLPGRPVLRDDRHRRHRAARPRGERVPLPRRAPLARGVHPGRQGGGRDQLRPRRAARRRGGQDDQRPVRRPAQPGPGLQRHPRPRRPRPRLRALQLVLRRDRRPPRPRRGRAARRAVPPVRQAAGPGAGRRRRRHRRDRPAHPRRDRRHPLGPRAPGRAPAVVAPRAAAAGGGRAAHQVRRGQALPGARPDRGRGPVTADRQRRRDPPARDLGDGRGPRRRHPRAALRALRRPGRPGAVRGVAARDVRRPPPPGTAAT